MKLLLLPFAIFLGCAPTAKQGYHTAAIAAPSLAPVREAVQRAQTANQAAHEASSRLEGKEEVVLQWLQEHKQ